MQHKKKKLANKSNLFTAFWYKTVIAPYPSFYSLYSFNLTLKQDITGVYRMQLFSLLSKKDQPQSHGALMQTERPFKASQTHCFLCTETVMGEEIFTLTD